MYLIPLAVATVCVGLVYGQSSSCFTPDGKSGECIQYTQCEPILTLVNKPMKTDRDYMLLRKSRCGNQDVPEVCCPKRLESEPVYSIDKSCNTPDGRPGTCVNINSCPHISNMLRPPVSQETLDFVNNSRCNSPEQHSVCCGSNPEEVQSGDCKTKMTAFPPDSSSECCGSTASFGNKIYGNATAIDEYPWTVVIEYFRKIDAATVVTCGGAIISGKYVLTAAHCIAGRILEIKTPKRVRLGEYDITNEGMDCVTVAGGGDDCTDGVIRIAIERTIPHPKYNPGKSKRDDIGLIRLKETAPYTDFIRPVCLPSKDLTLPENMPPNFSLFAVGWGETETKTKSDIKQHVNVPFVSQEKCQTMYNRTGRTLSLWRGQLCAGGIEGKDTCTGDSGGPLVYENQHKFELIGIISSGPTPCGQKGVPGIYTNVYEYLDWIKSVIVP